MLFRTFSGWLSPIGSNVLILFELVNQIPARPRMSSREILDPQKKEPNPKPNGGFGGADPAKLRPSVCLDCLVSSAEGLFFSRLDSKLWTSGSSVEAAELSFQDVMFQVSVWANYTTTLVMHEKMLVDWRNIWTRGHNTWKNMGIPWGANTHVQERLSNGSKENSQLGNGTGSKSLVYRGTLSGDCIHTHTYQNTHTHTHTRTSLCFVFLTASYITTL